VKVTFPAFTGPAANTVSGSASASSDTNSTALDLITFISNFLLMDSFLTHWIGKPRAKERILDLCPVPLMNCVTYRAAVGRIGDGTGVLTFDTVENVDAIDSGARILKE
jgi:hypothetical protein